MAGQMQVLTGEVLVDEEEFHGMNDTSIDHEATSCGFEHVNAKSCPLAMQCTLFKCGLKVTKCVARQHTYTKAGRDAETNPIKNRPI